MKKDDDDNKRLTVSVFIVATTLTMMPMHFSVPTFLTIPIGAFFVGLMITAFLAFLFILTKGYELRYRKQKDNMIDKYNHILYNWAMTAYVIVMSVILGTFLYKGLNDSAKAGNLFATLVLSGIFIGIVAFVNRRDLVELYKFVRTTSIRRLRKNQK